MCFAASARTIITSAEPQEEMRDELYESIRLYQTYLQEVIANEPSHDDDDEYQFSGFRFPLESCPAHLDTEYSNQVAKMEPILPGGRNLDHREFDTRYPSFYPYRSLASFESVRNKANRKKKMLLDVGCNGFAASPKQLVDNYAAMGMPFDELVMYDPDTTGMEHIPEVYKKDMKITFNQQYAQVGSRDNDDIIVWIEENVQKDDFFVLKFDVDDADINGETTGATMEWSFLADLLNSDALALVDEIYIELHFKVRSSHFRWHYETHSSRQHYDVSIYLFFYIALHLFGSSSHWLTKFILFN